MELVSWRNRNSDDGTFATDETMIYKWSGTSVNIA